MGFSDNRIQAIQNVKNIPQSDFQASVNPEIMMAAASTGATCNLYMTLDGYFYNHKFANTEYKTLAYVTSGWKWSACPTFGYTDGFAVAWGASTNLQLCMTNCGAEYYNYSTGNFKYGIEYSDQAWNNRPSGLNGVSFNFPLTKSSTNSDVLDEYAKEGYSMNAIMSTDYYVSSFTNNLKYGHAFLNVKPSFSIGSTGAIGLAAAFDVASEDYALTKLFVK